MNILDVYNGLRQQLLQIGLNIYKEIKPTSETGNCIVLNSVPIKKDNVQSIVDVIVILYLNKKNGQFDGHSAETLFPQISEGIKTFISSGTLTTIRERLEPETLNLDDSNTTSQFTFRTIIYN